MVSVVVAALPIPTAYLRLIILSAWSMLWCLVEYVLADADQTLIPFKMGLDRLYNYVITVVINYVRLLDVRKYIMAPSAIFFFFHLSLENTPENES